MAAATDAGAGAVRRRHRARQRDYRRVGGGRRARTRGAGVVAEAETALERLGVDAETAVVQGDPAGTIADYAERYASDLVVMPSQAREGASRLLLGSVTEKVIRLSPVPVLTVRMRPDERVSFPYRRVLVPTDGAPAERAATHAVDLAAVVGAAVEALSVVDDAGWPRRSGRPSATDATRPTRRPLPSGWRRWRPSGASRRRRASRTARPRTRSGPPWIGRGSRRARRDGSEQLDRLLLGSVAERVARSVAVPVITVPDGADLQGAGRRRRGTPPCPLL
ncbi:universal stress protein [Halobaculum litoreum]|uniref:Universal stress protein n=1 Tax=Halobaculum litoreum TaxID=3031998 RepID=A0ABD5XSZ0_9EURY